ncbi:MAG: glucosamine inositolphosphorylceramide transferase family protein [Devosia sp.]
MTNTVVIIPAKRPRSWQVQVVDRLRAAGHTIAIEHGEGQDAGASALDAVLTLEALRFERSLAATAAPIAADSSAGSPDLVVDLTGSAGERDVPVISILFDGSPSLSSVARALVSGRLPELNVLLDGKPAGTARPMVGERIWLTRGLNDVLARAITLVERTVRRVAAGQVGVLPSFPMPSAGPLTTALALRHVVALGPLLLLRALDKVVRHEFHWQVGYRFIDGPGVAETGSLAGKPWILLEDDGTRFFADPFAFAWEGRDYLFVEEYPHASGKGLISVAQFDTDGRPGQPRVILEEAYHLSYPQVFAHDGAVWMLPESSGADRLVLYRADPFPDRWITDTVLLEDVQISDATLLNHGGRFWLFASVSDGLGSASDSLHVYSAASLRGPWQPHAQNPIQIDRAAARPGGAFVRNGGEITLPVQDGTQTYGGGLGLARLLELDDCSVRLAPPAPVGGAPGWPCAGIHTLNRAGRLEVIDGTTRRPRWGARRQ